MNSITAIKNEMLKKTEHYLNTFFYGEEKKEETFQLLHKAFECLDSHIAAIPNDRQKTAFYRAAQYIHIQYIPYPTEFLKICQHMNVLFDGTRLFGQENPDGDIFYGFLELFANIFTDGKGIKEWRRCIPFESLWLLMAKHAQPLKSFDVKPNDYYFFIKASKNLRRLIARLKGQYPNADLSQFVSLLEKVWKRDKQFEIIDWIILGFKPDEVIEAFLDRKIKVKGDFKNALIYTKQYDNHSILEFTQILKTDEFERQKVIYQADEHLFGLAHPVLKANPEDAQMWKTRELFIQSVLDGDKTYINQVSKWLSSLKYSYKKDFKGNLESLSAKKTVQLIGIPQLFEILRTASPSLRKLLESKSNG